MGGFGWRSEKSEESTSDRNASVLPRPIDSSLFGMRFLYLDKSCSKVVLNLTNLVVFGVVSMVIVLVGEV